MLLGCSESAAETLRWRHAAWGGLAAGQAFFKQAPLLVRLKGQFVTKVAPARRSPARCLVQELVNRGRQPADPQPVYPSWANYRIERDLSNVAEDPRHAMKFMVHAGPRPSRTASRLATLCGTLCAFQGSPLILRPAA